ncbi:MAG: hypothetical protein NTY38_03655, partial [Acidobacteria bacterium]|nr:hypothetical protein [Acidobacteriota bacterium]
MGALAAAPGQGAETVTFAPDLDASIDFRYTPLAWQSCICFTDYDSSKTLVGEQGELRYGHPETNEVVQLSLMGMERDELVRQWVEAPGVPIVHTQLERPKARLELIAFATHRPEEGRVDNLILQVTPRSETGIVVVPVLVLHSKQEAAIGGGDGRNLLTLGAGGKLFAASSRPFVSRYPDGKAWFFRLRSGEPVANAPLWCLVRFPQEGQEYGRIRAGLDDPWGLLEEAREQWRGWTPVSGKVAWKLPRRFDDFLVAGSRGIFQMREKKNGRPTIQAGPTVYRGFWVLD